MQEPIVVALYKRVSSIEQVKGYSLDGQDHTLLRHCKFNNYVIYKIYSDEGISAKDMKHRPGMLEMLSDAKKGLFKKIIVWKLSRFARNMTDLAVACDRLDRIGITLESTTEAFDSTTISGRMIRSILGAVAQFDRETIGENVAMGLAERARQGKRTCHEILGYDPLGKDSFVINEKEAEYVEFCYDEYRIQRNIAEVTRLAKRKGYIGKRGKEPSTGAVYTILTRPEYAGYNIFNGELYRGLYTPIIKPIYFNETQDIIEQQGKNKIRKRKLYRIPA